MDMKAYRRMTLAELRGRRVRALKPLANGYGVIAAQTRLTITDKFSGLSLVGDECMCCRFRPRIRKVSPMDVELED